MSSYSDCHIHISLPNGKISDDEIKERLRAYADAGVTFLRDGGDIHGASIRAKKFAPDFGIDFRSPAFAIHKNGHYGSFIGHGFDNMDEYLELVKKAADEGADFIKVMLSGIMDFASYGVLIDGASRANVVVAEEIEHEEHDDHEHCHDDHEHDEHDGYIESIYKKNAESGGLGSDEIYQMVEAAHEAGLSVMAHCNGASNIKAALSAGVDSLEHGYYMDDECIDMLAASDTVWVPTVVPVAALIGKENLNFDVNEDVLKLILANHVKNIRRVVDLGGMVCPGTDAGAVCVDHAKSIESEYNFLKAATSNKNFDEAILMNIEQIKWRFAL